jgi:hypothetical protein
LLHLHVHMGKLPVCVVSCKGEVSCSISMSIGGNCRSVTSSLKGKFRAPPLCRGGNCRSLVKCKGESFVLHLHVHRGELQVCDFRFKGQVSCSISKCIGGNCRSVTSSLKGKFHAPSPCA